MAGPEDDGPAKERVVLKKVKTRRQEVDLTAEELALMKKFESEMNPKAELTNDEITVINIFEKQKLFFERILIKLNQTRAALGLPLFKSAEIQGILDSLIDKGLVSKRDAPGGLVYFLTEAGLDFLGIL